MNVLEVTRISVVYEIGYYKVTTPYNNSQLIKYLLTTNEISYVNIKAYKHQFKVYNKELLNKWFIKHFSVPKQWGNINYSLINYELNIYKSATKSSVVVLQVFYK